MSTVILNILCEGQTEEAFVKKVLKPHLKAFGLVVKQRLLVTSSKKGAKGGLTKYEQAKGDLMRWFNEVGDSHHDVHYFTTMFDLYALPSGFPGIHEAQSIVDPYQKVLKLEEEFARDIQKPNIRFIPYIQLHEFEALLFCDIEKLKVEYPNSGSKIKALKSVLTEFQGNPELINTNPQTAPSKRIIHAIESKYRYNKPKSGADVTASIGIETLMSKCPHFASWVKRLESLAD